MQWLLRSPSACYIPVLEEGKTPLKYIRHFSVYKLTRGLFQSHLLNHALSQFHHRWGIKCLSILPVLCPGLTEENHQDGGVRGVQRAYTKPCLLPGHVLNSPLTHPDVHIPCMPVRKFSKVEETMSGYTLNHQSWSIQAKTQNKFPGSTCVQLVILFPKKPSLPED